MPAIDAQTDPGGYLPLDRLRKQFQDYLGLKTDETKEQRQARLYYHGSQWSAEQLKELKKRKQPPTTTPAFARKINGFVGLVERLRQDPKAYPRTPKHEQGAELSTAALRYALDEQEWQARSPLVSYNGAVDGIGGLELSLTPGDSGTTGDFDIEIDVVDPETFFYDPRSFRHDFSDARYMGVSKWMDVGDAAAMFPDQAQDLEALSAAAGSEFTIESERETKWVNTRERQVRIVEHWYRMPGDRWCWAFYTAGLKLSEGPAFLRDEKGRDICRFIMWSAFVDQDGDRYGFFRYMKSLVDEINHRNSKALHLLNMRRIKAPRGAFDDIELARRESVRPDGVIEYNPIPGFEVEFDDARSISDMRGQLDMQERARAELENFGPNPALVGGGSQGSSVDARSGRAIALLQQAGLAELGPFIIAYRGWKIRLYRAVWCAIRQHWTAERWIRVTDDEGLMQQVQVNGQQIDPMTGQMQIVNALGSLDVDIIIDEGPDAVNMQADALEVLQTAAAQGQQIPPQIMIELLPLPDSLKKKLLGMLQPPPEQQQAQQVAQQLQMAGAQAQVQERQAGAQLRMAQARKADAEAQAAGQPEPQAPTTVDAGPTPAEQMESMAHVDQMRADAVLKLAQADETRMDTALAPQQMQQRAAADQARAAAMRQRPAPGSSAPR